MPPRSGSLRTKSGSSSSSKDARPSSSNTHSLRTTYLIGYNLVSALLWAVVLAAVITITPSKGVTGLHHRVADYTRWTQTLAALEVVHAAVGLVRAPLLTTVMQVASRFLLVWGIDFLFPGVALSTTMPPAYAAMLLAWSATEVVRYSYFALQLSFGKVPGFLTWLRYNAFFVLYPLGISSECWLVWKSQGPGARVLGWREYVWVVYAILAVYVPGSYVLYTHMMKQRRKIMRGGEGTKKR